MKHKHVHLTTVNEGPPIDIPLSKFRKALIEMAIRDYVEDPNDYLELEEDIKVNGIREPLIAYLLKDGYEIQDGFHRFAIAVKLNINSVSCIVRVFPKE